MARNLLKRYFPTPEKIKNNPALRMFDKFLHDPNLFHLNRHSVSVAFFWGLFIAILPIPGQMPLSALAAVVFRCNLPIAVALAWVSNPFTTPFLLVISYAIGSFILQSERLSFDPHAITFEWFLSSVNLVWKPVLLGCVITGLIAGVLGYLVMQLYWRWNVSRAWSRRRKSRQAKNRD